MNNNHNTEQQDWKDRFTDAPASSAAGSDDAGVSASGPSVEQSAKAASEADSKSCGGQPCMPKPTFSTFVLSLASSALVQLGEVPDPATGGMHEDLALAKHSIDILSMLQEKVTNGLDGEESRLLEGLLYELRMKFIMKN